MRLVIDTNILVSGLLSPYGAPAHIVRMMVAGAFDVCYDARILSEYEEVLNRPKFAFKKEEIESVLWYIEYFGYPVAATPLSRKLRDPFDEPFLEVAIAGGADYLLTGNISHFPPSACRGVRVLTPAQFLAGFSDK